MNTNVKTKSQSTTRKPIRELSQDELKAVAGGVRKLRPGTVDDY